MAVERTLSIIKPDAVAKNVIGEILARFEKAGLKIVAARMAWLSQAEAEGFYAVHRERPGRGSGRRGTPAGRRPHLDGHDRHRPGTRHRRVPGADR